MFDLVECVFYVRPSDFEVYFKVRKIILSIPTFITNKQGIVLYTTRTLNLPKYWTYHFRRCVSNYWENFGQKKTRCRQRRRHSCWCIFRGSCLCLKKRFMRQIRPFGTRTLNKFVLLFVNISQTRKLSLLNKFSKTKWCVYWSQIWDMILDAVNEFALFNFCIRG